MNVTDKIKHVFVLVLENRSFDHVFGYSYLGGVNTANGAQTEIDGLAGGPGSNTGPDGRVYRTTSGATFTIPGNAGNDGDPGHEFLDVVRQLCGPKNVPPPILLPDGLQIPAPLPNATYPPIDNSGFVADYNLRQPHEDPQIVMDCFDGNNLPILTQLAMEFMLCDRWFAAVPGPTWPNRFFIHAASATGQVDSPPIDAIVAGFKFHRGTIYDRLRSGGHQYKIYIEQANSQVGHIKTNDDTDLNIGPLSSFHDDLQNAGYPYSYIFIEPNSGVGIDAGVQDDMHPPSDVRNAESLVKRLYETLRSSPLWTSSALVITFDEHGGFYDHVHPPACVPLDDGSVDNTYGFKFDQLGVRVPAIVVSAWVKRNSIDHTVYEHSSIIASLTRLFALDHLTSRDANANDFLHAFAEDQSRQDTPATLNGNLDAALAINVNIPSTLHAGDKALVSVTMQNAGATTWTKAHSYRLGSQNPPDNQVLGVARVDLPNDVAPGASVTFSFQITAPTTPGTVVTQWQMLRESVHWFGQTANPGSIIIGRSQQCIDMASQIKTLEIRVADDKNERASLDPSEQGYRAAVAKLDADITKAESDIAAIQKKMAASGCN